MPHQDSEESRFLPIKTSEGSATRLFLGMLALVVVLAIAAWALWIPRKSAPPISHSRPVPLTSHLGVEQWVALSPDGTYVAFAWNGGTGGNTDIYVQVVGTAEPHPLTSHPASDTAPAWSPNGTQIAFVRQDSDFRHSIHVVSVLGGSETKVADGVSAGLQGLGGGINGISWSPVEPVLAIVHGGSRDETDSIFLLSLESGEKRRLTTAPSGWQDCNPVFSPNGDEVAFNRRGPDELILCIQNVQGGKPRCFDSYRSVWDHDWTSDGSALIVSGGEIVRRQLFRISVDADEVEQLPFGEGAHEVSLARLGGRLAYQVMDRRVDLWRISGPNALRPRAPVRFASTSTRDERVPQYSPDGKRVAFRSNRSGSEAVWICNADGTKPRKLIEMPGIWMGAWSPSGNQIGFAAYESADEENARVFVMDASGGTPRRITPEWLSGGSPAWSPDGRLIYFNAVGPNDQYEIYRIPADGGAPVQLTREGGMVPQVTEGGQVLYWRDWEIWTVSTDGREETLVLSKPCHVFCWCTWKENIVYIHEGENGPSIERFDLETRETTVLHPFGEDSFLGAGITVSPDGQSILYTQAEVSLDLMLVENFR